jgi:DNA-binding MarR family transcriptional regulator
MSSDTTEQLTDRIAEAVRDVIADAVLTNERIARGIGLNVVDLQTFGVLLRADVPLTAGELSGRTGMPTSTTTRVLDRLEKAGFVGREADPADRRKVLVHARRERMQDLAAQYGAIVEGMRELHRGFTRDELAVVARYLEAMAAADLTV